jgi:hypothetical protein
MTGERRDFLEDFNAVKVPSPELPENATDEEADLLVNTFFQNIQDSLGLGDLTLSEFFERARAIDNSFEELRKRGGQVLASVMFAYDETSQRVPYFMKHELSEETVHDIRELQYFERIQHGLE